MIQCFIEIAFFSKNVDVLLTICNYKFAAIDKNAETIGQRLLTEEKEDFGSPDMIMTLTNTFREKGIKIDPLSVSGEVAEFAEEFDNGEVGFTPEMWKAAADYSGPAGEELPIQCRKFIPEPNTNKQPFKYMVRIGATVS